MRHKTKEIQIGKVTIGGTNPIAIQSMTNTKTEDVEATVRQILELEAAGCEIIRCAIPTMEAAKSLEEIKKQIHIPLVADIHFDYRLAIAAVEHGADKIRINPGNIGSNERIKAVVDCCKERQVPIRVGVNSGSLEKNLVEKYGGVTARGLVESALDKVSIITDMGYDNLVISIKSSDVLMCIRAHEELAKQTDPICAGDNFGYILEKYKGFYGVLGAERAGETVYPQHHCKFDLDEKAFRKGSEFMARFAIDFLNNE